MNSRPVLYLSRASWFFGKVCSVYGLKVASSVVALGSFAVEVALSVLETAISPCFGDASDLYFYL